MSVHLGHEGGGLLGQPLARFEQAAADQQHDVGAVEIKHLGDASGVMPPAGTGTQGRKPVHARRARRGESRGRSPANSRSVRHGWGRSRRRRRAAGTACRSAAAARCARRPPCVGMRDEGDVRVLPHQPVEIGRPTIIGATMTVSMPAPRASAICAAHARRDRPRGSARSVRIAGRALDARAAPPRSPRPAPRTANRPDRRARGRP